MSDIDDLVTTLRELREAIGVSLPLVGGPAITGIEVTQAVQYHRSSLHLSDSQDRGMDNAATLVAHKPAVVRVYVRPPWGTAVGEPVTGTLLVERGKFFGPYTTVGTYSPVWSGTVTPQDDAYTAERGNRWRSLNFRIPAAEFRGSLRLTVTLDDGQTATASVSARLLQTLRVRVVLVAYDGPSTSSPPAGTRAPQLTLPAPTLADAQAAAALALRMMPVQQTGSFAVAGSMNWFVPLDDARSTNGGCSGNWDGLMGWLGLMRDNDGNRPDVVYYGLLPAGMPVAVPGCGVDGLGAGRAGDQPTFVHEIGHGYNFPHAPSGNVGTPDPAYPVYEPYPSASIGEYGMDVLTGQVFSPATSTDYMSYGPAPWMSLYHHEALNQHPRLAPSWIREKNPFVDVPVEFDPEQLWWPDPPWERDHPLVHELRPVISVRGLVDERGHVTVTSVARVTASPLLHGRRTGWTAQLLAGSGEVVSRAVLARVDSHGCGSCGCGDATGHDPHRLPFAFHAMLPDVEAGSALRILDTDGGDAWERTAPETPAAFERAHAVVEGDHLHLRWTVAGDASAEDVWLQWSRPDGGSWHGLAVGLREGRAELGLAGLPAGPVLLRLLAHDGFSTAVSDTLEVEVPELGPEVAILHPADGSTVLAGPWLDVLGSAVDQAGMPLEEESLRWVLDDEPVGSGRVASLEVGSGEHELRLVTHSGRAGEARVRFRALSVEEADEDG